MGVIINKQMHVIIMCGNMFRDRKGGERLLSGGFDPYLSLPGVCRVLTLGNLRSRFVIVT